MRSLILSLFGLFGFGYLAICALMFFTQRSQMYFPTAEVTEVPVPGAQLWRLETAPGIVLRIWTLGVAAAERPALIYFGGNGEDVAWNAPQLAQRFGDFSIYLVHYRGYGGSSGTPSEAAFVADAKVIYDAVRARHATAPIHVMGRSLGSGVAVQLAAARPVARLVLVTPFDTLVEVAREHFPWLPVGWLMQDRYESATHVPRILRDRAAGSSAALSTRALVVIALQDEVVPVARSESLVRALESAGIPTEVLRLENARHNDLERFPSYLRRVESFLRAPLAPAAR